MGLAGGARQSTSCASQVDDIRIRPHSYSGLQVGVSKEGNTARDTIEPFLEVCLPRSSGAFQSYSAPQLSFLWKKTLHGMHLC